MSKQLLIKLLNTVLDLKSKYNLSWHSIPYIGDIQKIDRINFNNGIRKDYNISLNVFFKDDLFYYTYLDERGGTEIICQTSDYNEILYQVIIRILDEEARKVQKSPYINNDDGTRQVLFDVITENKKIYKERMMELLNSINPKFRIRYEKEK